MSKSFLRVLVGYAEAVNMVGNLVNQDVVEVEFPEAVDASAMCNVAEIGTQKYT